MLNAQKERPGYWTAYLMGPRKRKRLLTGLTLIVIAILGIQYTGYNELDVPNVEDVFYNPSLPNLRDGNLRRRFGWRTFSPGIHNEKKGAIKRGPSRHLQEEIHVQDSDPSESIHKDDIQKANNNRVQIKSLRDKTYKTSNQQNRLENVLETKPLKESGADASVIVTYMAPHKIPTSFIAEPSCPACLGTSLCDEFYEGNINIFSNAENIEQGLNSGGVFSGLWNETGIILRKVGSTSRDALDLFICSNGSEKASTHCEVGVAVMESVLSLKGTDLSPHQIRSAILPINSNPLSVVSPATCANNYIFDKVKQLYRIHHLKSRQHSAKLAMLTSSLTLDPTPVIFKFIESEVPALLPYFPKLYGVCGQVAVLREEGIPLINFLPESWEVRVNISIELLSFVDDIWNASPRWGFLFLDFNYSSFVVLPDGRLQMTELDKLMVIDKQELQDQSKSAVNTPPCNKQCFAVFLDALRDTNHSHCSRLHNPEEFMYMMASQRLLSDLFTTKMVYMFSEEKEIIDENQPGGLLYDAPLEVDGKISELLYECTLESDGGSRMHSAKMLKRVLEILRRGFQYQRMKRNKVKTIKRQDNDPT